MEISEIAKLADDYAKDDSTKRAFIAGFLKSQELHVVAQPARLGILCKSEDVEKVLALIE